MKTSNKLLLTGILCVILIPAILLTGMIVRFGVNRGIEGNGVRQNMDYKLSDFTDIKVSGSYDLNIKQGSENSVSLTADSNILPMIQSNVRNNELNILIPDYSSRSSVKIDITVKNLQEVSTSGSYNADINVPDGNSLIFNGSGAGKVTMSGKLNNLEIHDAGAGKINSIAMKAEDVSINLAGAGKADVYASGTLTVNIAGLGKVNYSGNPKEVKKNIAGFGKIENESDNNNE